MTRRVLRLPAERNQRPVETSVGDLISNAFGAELVQFCHFGKEPSIIHLLMKSLTAMEIDLRPLMLGSPVYNTKKHIGKLGLQRMIPGLFHSTQEKPDKFLKGFTWKSAGSAVMSEGMGVNMWSILMMAALMGSDEIHCKASSRVATSILTLILNLSPSAATPGNMIPVRSFNERTRRPECVMISSKNRPEHFIRPVEDDNLAMNGTFTYCQADRGTIPEDYLGCAHIWEMSKFLKCKYYEVPPKNAHGNYQLLQKRYYHIYRHNAEEGSRAAHGILLIDKDGVHMEWTVDGSDAVEQAVFGFFNWHEGLRELGFLVMPHVWRSGAAVSLDHGDIVGCLVAQGTRQEYVKNGIDPDTVQFISNYDHFNKSYHALVDDGVLASISVIQMLDTLLPPGTLVWVKHNTLTWESLKDFFPYTTMPDDEANERMVQARLNIPIDMVC